MIVTGGAAGIGYAIASAFAHKGYRVAIVDISSETSSKAAQKLTEETGAETFGIAADVSDPKASATAYADIISALGPADVLVNNAGIMPPRKGWIEEIPVEDFQQMIDTHLGSAVK